jgi:predicted transcriptional regulator
MKRKAFALLLESLLALRRENKEVLWSSMVKDTMKRKKPSFNEAYHGYRTFSELLEDAQKEGLLELDTDKRSRTYVVTRFGTEMQSAALGKEMQSAPGPGPAPKSRPSRRRRSSGKRRSPAGAAVPATEAVDGATPSEARPPADVPPQKQNDEPIPF